MITSSSMVGWRLIPRLGFPACRKAIPAPRVTPWYSRTFFPIDVVSPITVPGAVIDKEPRRYGCARVDIDAGPRMGVLGS